MLDENGIVWQIGELGKVDIGGGGTVAQYIADLDIDVVDLGIPVLSMHAPFEVIAKTDLYMAYRAFSVFFK
jgi:aspartyl aminopeptidase